MPGLRTLTFPVMVVAAVAFSLNVASDPLPPDLTYRPLPSLPFSDVKMHDEAQKAAVMQRQRNLLDERYDLADRAISGLLMSGGRKPVQDGVRVKLPAGETWASVAAKSPQEIRGANLLPRGFLPLPHVKQATGGQVFPENQIGEIGRDEQRDLRRFDVDFDLPDHLTPNFRRRSSSPRIPNLGMSRAAIC
jgi:cytochrome c peroxidase